MESPSYHFPPHLFHITQCGFFCRQSVFVDYGWLLLRSDVGGKNLKIIEIKCINQRLFFILIPKIYHFYHSKQYGLKLNILNKKKIVGFEGEIYFHILAF